MKLSLTPEANGNRRFVLLAPAGITPRGAFQHVESDESSRQDLIADMQRLRGRIYLQDGAITADELTADGRHEQDIDEQSWHLLILSSAGRVLGCTRYLQHLPGAPYTNLRVRTAALAYSDRWSEPFRRSIEHELEDARRNNFSFVEVGGWALDESVRGSSDAVRSVLFTYAWSQVIGGCLGLSTATQRNGSASILRRIGGRPLEWNGSELPPYYDPHYKCEMEVIRFDSRLPSPKYKHVIDEMRLEIPAIPVICGPRQAEAWTTFVGLLRPAPGLSAKWAKNAVAPAA